MNSLFYENIVNLGMPLIGVDEVGVGCLAGPVVATALKFRVPYDKIPIKLWEGLKDSKKLSAKRRIQLFNDMHTYCDFSIGYVLARDIDRINILQARLLAMKRAILRLFRICDVLYNVNDDSAIRIWIDGSYIPKELHTALFPHTIYPWALIKGDMHSKTIGAASIIAKVFRDRYMIHMNQLHLGYGFDQHKGYGTSKHLEALNKLGPCVLHRRSFAPVANLLLH